MVTTTETTHFNKKEIAPIIIMSNNTFLWERDIIEKYPSTEEKLILDKYQLIEELYGKYAGPISLTKALLEERAAERAREEAKYRPFNE